MGYLGLAVGFYLTTAYVRRVVSEFFLNDLNQKLDYSFMRLERDLKSSVNECLRVREDALDISFVELSESVKECMNVLEDTKSIK